MRETSEAFRFAYEPATIRYGAGCVAGVSEELDRHNVRRAVIVCGQTVGDTPAVIDPLRNGLGDRLTSVFDRTTPEKRLETAIEAAELLTESGADALVAVGGGSSLDVAKVASVVAASEQSPDALGAVFESRGTLPVPAGELPPVFAVPTTLAGADLSILAGITASPDSGLVEHPRSGGVSSERLMPAAVYYDPELVATTPRPILTGSAMNGFDKGIETLYARTQTPVTDATAIRGLQLLCAGLPTLVDEPDVWALDEILQGLILVQYGISRPDETTLSLIHAFGHGMKAHADIQQGVAHAVIAPHALSFLFERVDGRRRLLADALGVSTVGTHQDVLAQEVVEAVQAVRTGLGLPARLRDVDAVDRSMLTAMAETTAEDHLLANLPQSLSVSAEELADVLQAAW